MNTLVDLLSLALIVAGSFFVLTAALGLVRLPDFFSRTHAPGVLDTLGAGLLLLGFALQLGFDLTLVKLALVLLFILITGPTAAHALARTALQIGVKPEVDGRDDRVAK
ncbi:MAG: monovalent cation/H(+) antiporter subunit G [Halofilum sp. (in: g-proteobacteria)]